jgi:excisionase family DNA binding protein
MEALNEIRLPSKKERNVAKISYSAFVYAINQIKTDQAEIEIEETKDKIVVPLRALQLLGDILKAMGQGRPISIVPMATEVTTQSAADILGCSRPFLVKLLEEGKIEFIKIGKHRRIRFEDVLKYKQMMKEEQKNQINEIMNFDEQLGLYDS